jgi:D-lactate dehydrogenase
MKIAFFELEDWEKKRFNLNLKKHNLYFFDKPLKKSDLPKLKTIDILCVSGYSHINKSIISSLPKLKYITTRSTGFDHIDINNCKKNNIKVSNVPTYAESTVAEHTFALILALSRKLYPSIKRTHEDNHFETDETLRGFDLKNKTLGVIGYGHIGKHVVKIGLGFEMNVLVYDIRPKATIAHDLGFTFSTLDKLIRDSDVISLHLPYNKLTHHLINKSKFNKMKKSSILINTSRGELIKTSDLISSLKKNKIAGAALDVLEGEALIKEENELLKNEFKLHPETRTLLQDHELMDLDNVIITPHNAFNSQESLNRIISTTIDNIKSFSDKKIINEVF